MQSEDDLEVEVVPTNQLSVIIKETNLEPQLADEFTINFQEHFKMASEWAKKAKKIIVTRDTQLTEMQEARTARLFLRGKRLEIENFRKQKKEYYLRAGQAIDKVAGFLKDMIIPTEEHLDRQEHFLEFKKKAEDERLLAEARAREEARLAEEAKAQAEERERLRVENEKLRKEAQEKERINQEELKKVHEANKKALEAEQQRARQAELELREKRQSELKAEADKIKEAERLLKAGDIELLSKLYFDIEEIKIPEIKSQINKRIIEDVKSHLGLALLKIKPAIVLEEI